MAFLDENGVAQFWAAVKDRLAGAFNSVEFDVAEQAANLVSGDSIGTAFGKLAKNYTSLVDQISNLTTNKFDKNKVVANYTTSATGYALDASLGPAIKTKMDLADTLSTNYSDLESHTKRLKKISRERKYVADVVNVASGENKKITYFDVPGGSKYIYVVLGHVRLDKNGTNIRVLASMESDPTSNEFRSFPASAVTSYGAGGVTAWGFVNPSETSRRIYVSTHNYDTQARDFYGALYAFAICDITDDSWAPY